MPSPKLVLQLLQPHVSDGLFWSPAVSLSSAVQLASPTAATVRYTGLGVDNNMTLVHAQPKQFDSSSIDDPIRISHDHQFLPYKHLRPRHLQQLSAVLQDSTQSTDEQQAAVCQTLRDAVLTADDTQLTAAQQHAVTELLYTTYAHTLHVFGDSPLKQSTFVSLVVSVIEHSIQRTLCPSDDSKGAQRYRHADTATPSLAEIVQYADQLILQHSVERPPYSISVFSLSDLKHISDFLLQHVFNSVDMWQYVFNG